MRHAPLFLEWKETSVSVVFLLNICVHSSVSLLLFSCLCYISFVFFAVFRLYLCALSFASLLPFCCL